MVSWGQEEGFGQGEAGERDKKEAWGISVDDGNVYTLDCYDILQWHTYVKSYHIVDAIYSMCSLFYASITLFLIWRRETREYETTIFWLALVALSAIFYLLSTRLSNRYYYPYFLK